MSNKEIKVNPEEVKRKALEQFEKEETQKAEEAAVAAEVKRLRLEKDEKNRKENELLAKQEHDSAIKGIRQFHGNVMRKVASRYSADSKPFFIDKGV